jgi:hypothetical protein
LMLLCIVQHSPACCCCKQPPEDFQTLPHTPA